MTIITIENLTHQFPGTTQPALKGINYYVQEGDFIILLGSNGSGKSTLLKMLYRQHYPDEGQINLFNKPLPSHHLNYFSHHVAVLTQHCAESLFTSLTIYENFQLVSKTKFRIRFLRHYLQEYNPQLSKKLHLPVEQLSGGEKQALALALCLLHPPSILLLDEHTSALDPRTSHQLMQLTHRMVQKHGITCILTTHNLDIAVNYGNRILVLRDGEIYMRYERDKKNELTKEILAARCFG